MGCVTMQAIDGGSNTSTQDLTVAVADDAVESAITVISLVIKLSKLDGTNGFFLNGVSAGNLSGFSVSSAGM